MSFRKSRARGCCLAACLVVTAVVFLFGGVLDFNYDTAGATNGFLPHLFFGFLPHLPTIPNLGPALDQMTYVKPTALSRYLPDLYQWGPNYGRPSVICPFCGPQFNNPQIPNPWMQRRPQIPNPWMQRRFG